MSRTGFRRYLAPIGLAVGLALILTSCFGGEEDDGTTTTTGGSAQDITTTSTAPPPPPPVTVEAPPPPPPVTVEAPPPPPPVTVEAPPPPTTRAPGEPLVYTVQQGDTLFSIATQFGVTVDELVELNNITNPDVIFVDDLLTIPPPG